MPKIEGLFSLMVYKLLNLLVFLGDSRNIDIPKILLTTLEHLSARPETTQKNIQCLKNIHSVINLTKCPTSYINFVINMNENI